MNNIYFNNEKINWAQEKANLSMFSISRGFLSFYIKMFNSLSSKPQDKKILDVGCGSGGLIKTLKGRFPNYNYWGCDISKSCIKNARLNSGGVSFDVADDKKLPYRDKMFDVVIMNSVLDHSERPDLAVKEIYRVLKSGGVFLSTTPVEADLAVIHGYLSRFKSFRRHRYEYLGHIHAFSVKSLIELIEARGFRVQDIYRDWFYFAQLVDILYYPLLAFFNRKPEETLGKKARERTVLGFVVKYIRGCFQFIQNIESIISYRIPNGLFVFARAIKE